MLFRDRLRDSAADRDLYAHTKLALARQERGRVQNYADAETAVGEQFSRALNRRRRTNPFARRLAPEGLRG